MAEPKNKTAAKTAIEELSQMVSLLSSTLESTADGILVVDRYGKIVDSNRRFAALWRIPEDIIGQKDDNNALKYVLDQLSEPDKFTEKIKYLYEHTNEVSLDILNFKDGRVFERYSCPQYQNGKVVGRVWSFRDISEQKQAEDALRASEEKYRGVVDNIGIGISMISPNMEILALNRQMKEWFPHIDISEKPLCYKSFNTPPRETICTYCPTCKTLEDGKVHESITETPTRDTIVNYRVVSSPIRDNKGKVIAAVEMVEDITLRKHVEDNLLKEKTLLHTLLDFYRRAYMPINKIEAFIVEECIRISKSSLGFFGFVNEDETEMRTHVWSQQALEECKIDFKPIVFPLVNAGIWAEAIRKQEPLVLNNYLKPDPRKKGCPDGHVPLQRLLSIPVVKGDKVVAIMAVANKKQDYTETDILHLSLFIGSMWDVLKRTEAEENLRILNEQLELKVKERTQLLVEAQNELIRKEKLATLGQLSGSVGHELRNPLGVMNNAVFFLKTVMTDANDTVKEYLDIIKQEIDNSQRIITDLLDFARTKTPQAVPTGVGALVTETLGKCLLPENIDVQTDIPDTLPHVTVDPFQMGQVLQNLITNAIQAMPKGGTLTVAARQVQSPMSMAQGPEKENLEPATVDRGSDTDFVEISVKDTGEGISPENRDKLFQPLFTTKAKGIGLGLTVCRNLTEANGSRIEVESKPGEGTTFTIFLPVKN